jgi:hypothetical protein
MPQLPVNIENDVTIQNNTTGAVDYLQFNGNTLTQSAMFNYGIAGMNIVSSDLGGPGYFTLVAQSATTGVVDFLAIDGAGNLVSSVMGNASLPPIIGQGEFGNPVAGQAGDEFVSQLANGELDFLAFNDAGELIASDLVANSVGLPHAVGAAIADGGSPGFQPFAGNGSSTSENVITQLADGSLDTIGFSGSFATGSLSVSASFLLPGSAGTAPVGAVNQDDIERENLEDAAGHQGVQMVSQLPSGQLDFQSYNSAYNDTANDGVLYASNLLTPSFSGFHVVDGGLINNILFPIS